MTKMKETDWIKNIIVSELESILAKLFDKKYCVESKIKT